MYRQSMKILLLSLTLMASVGAWASGQKEQYWSSVKISSGFNEDFTLLGELLHRYSADSEEFVTRSVRLGLQYQFENKTTYAFILENRMTNSDDSDEIRVIHQVGHGWQLEKVKLALRGRFEQREYSNSSAIMNRLRARVKVTGTGYKFWNLTPFALAEQFYITNEAPPRPAGGTELRLQAGVSFKAIGGKVSLSYLDRTTRTPDYKVNPSSTTDYGIVDLGLSWGF